MLDSDHPSPEKKSTVFAPSKILWKFIRNWIPLTDEQKTNQAKHTMLQAYFNWDTHDDDDDDDDDGMLWYAIVESNVPLDTL